MRRILGIVFIIWLALTCVGFVAVGLFCTWHLGYMEETAIERRAVLTWLWGFLIPTVMLGFMWFVLYGQP